MCFLRACHDHNKIAPCGMIQVFEVKKIKIENNRNEGDAGAICTFAFKNVLLFKCI